MKTTKLSCSNQLYRGLKMTQDEIETYNVGKKINLTGYTSTSKDFKTALEFSMCGASEFYLPVIFEIQFLSDNGLFELTSGFSAYPNEGEVLVQDGLEYLVVDNSE